MIDGISQVGGGAMSDVSLSTYVAVVKHKEHASTQVSKWLGTSKSPAIVVRIQKNKIYLDLRTLTEEGVEILIKAFAAIK